MRLVYDKKFNGKRLPVEVGDDAVVDDVHYRIDSITVPKNPASTGRVVLRSANLPDSGTIEFYPSVIGATWIEREDRGRKPRKDEQGNLLRLYDYEVGGYVTLKRWATNEEGRRVEEGSVMRINAISPKVTLNKGWAISNPDVYDTKEYFLNLAPVGNTYSSVRVDFVMVRRPTRKELSSALSKVEGLFLQGKLTI